MRLGFGCMRLPVLRAGELAIDWAEAGRMVERAITGGISYFDTAWIYHSGESELFIGDALSRHKRDSFMLADKMPIWLVKKAEDVAEIFSKQLEKCKVEYFDYYLLHALDARSWEKAERFKVYDQLLEYKKQGRIKRLGFSFHDGPDVLEVIAASKEWDFAQIQLNYLDYADIDAKRQYEILTERGIPVVVMEPLRGGALCNLPENTYPILSRLTGRAVSGGQEAQNAAAEVALRFVLSLENVMMVLSGMSAMWQLEGNLDTMRRFTPLNTEEMGLVEELARLYRKSGSLPCTGCKYCIDCPKSINIPSILSIYNNYLATNNAINFNYCYKALREEERGGNCIACGKCEEACPQHIKIIDSLAKIEDTIKSFKPR